MNCFEVILLFYNQPSRWIMYLRMCPAFYNDWIDWNGMDWAIPYGAHTGPRNILNGHPTGDHRWCPLGQLGNTYGARLLSMLKLFVGRKFDCFVKPATMSDWKVVWIKIEWAKKFCRTITYIFCTKFEAFLLDTQNCWNASKGLAD